MHRGATRAKIAATPKAAALAEKALPTPLAVLLLRAARNHRAARGWHVVGNQLQPPCRTQRLCLDQTHVTTHHPIGEQAGCNRRLRMPCLPKTAVPCRTLAVVPCATVPVETLNSGRQKFGPALVTCSGDQKPCIVPQSCRIG